MTPTIATTIMSSMSVNPRARVAAGRVELVVLGVGARIDAQLAILKSYQVFPFIECSEARAGLCNFCEMPQTFADTRWAARSTRTHRAAKPLLGGFAGDD